MIVLQTYLIYILLFILMLYLAKRASERNEWGWMLLAILVYSVVFGVRYGVGVDYFGYLLEYQQAQFAQDSVYDVTEIGFKFVRDMFATNGVHFSIFFGLIAFVQLWLICKAVKKDKFIYPYLIAAFFLGCVWLSYSNGLRQQLAFCIFAYSLLFVENKKWIFLHWLLLLLAVTMHNSAVMLFVVAPLLWMRTDWFRNIKIQYLLLLAAIVIGRYPGVESWLMSIEGNFGLLESFMEETGYEDYFVYDDGDEIFKKLESVGIGYYLELGINVLLIWFSGETKKYNSSNKMVSYIYNFAFIGMLLHYIFITSLLVSRLNYYFYGFVFIFGAYVLHYLYNNNKKMFWVYCLLCVMTFVGVMYRMDDNTSAFYFFWQSSLYGK